MSGVTLSAELVLFLIFGAATLVSATMVVVSRNPIRSAMSLVATFFFLAGIYVLLWAHTIAVLQILVYAGAIMVLFLFVIMLLAPTEDHVETIKLAPARIIALVAATLLFLVLVDIFLQLPVSPDTWTTNADQVQRFGTIAELGKILYTQWLFPFEAVSVLLLVAILGAVMVAKAKV